MLGSVSTRYVHSTAVGSRCETVRAECQTNPCHNKATSLDLLGHYECLCVPGEHYQEKLCKCLSKPYSNRGICQDLPGGYFCSCSFGYTGTNCEVAVDFCSTTPCQNGGSGSQSGISYKCRCAPGWIGSHCETPLFGCKESTPQPSVMGMEFVCVDCGHSYICHCFPGYTGSLCEVKTGFCQPNPCQNGNHCEINPDDFATISSEAKCFYGGACRDEISGFSCMCLPGFVGLFTIMERLQQETPIIALKIEEAERKVQATVSAEQYQAAQGKLNESLRQFRLKLESRKRQKFLRDESDYAENRVYRWAPREGYRTRNQRKPERGPGTNVEDLEAFFRRIRLSAELNDNVEMANTETDHYCNTFFLQDWGLYNSSTYMPAKSNAVVETYIKGVKYEMSLLENRYKKGEIKLPKENITLEERRALLSLQNNKSLVIKPADKGGAVVVMDKEFYINTIITMLDDTTTYQKLTTNPLFSIQRAIKDCVENALQLEIIDNKLAAYLIQTNPITPVLYILPKIHKNMDKPPGRPIVAGQNFFNTKSFIRDTGDFINKINTIDGLTADAILVTLDVESLYTSIPHDGGVEAVGHHLDKDETLDGAQKKFLLTLLQIVLCKNYFLFQDVFFLQTKGTAMGSNVAPSYPNLFMDVFENHFVYNNCQFLKNCKCWYRYIDDIFMIWTGRHSELIGFIDGLNKCSPFISFTMHCDMISIPYLDVLVKNTMNGRLDTDLFVKQTDRNTLLRFDSFHPSHIKKSLPKSQVMRVKRIVQNEQQQADRVEEMKDKFRTRGYPSKILDGMDRVTEGESANSERQTKRISKRIPFVNQYNVLSGEISKIVRKEWSLLTRNFPDKMIFRSPPVMSYSKAETIGTKLVKADLGPSTKYVQTHLKTPKNGTFPCCGCSHCSNVLKGEWIYHPLQGTRIPIRVFFTCMSTFVVYSIKCPCGKIYVGKTIRCLRDRLTEHKSAIRNKLNQPIAKHFNESGHTISQLRFQVLDTVPRRRRGGNRDKELLRKEAQWIRRLGTLSPHGLNHEYDLNPFLLK
ncbi:hypothetical protein XELAEV_18039149mg [Xenopus laevis]|uniref:Uncharacterized protein n=1 Tax=Xenopus laevis TaxID=8355 RepID=A0A974H7N5_XENLA|nr:hypothetical protein XELAEV_18039149mg [Xenopus laevis]